MREGDTKTWNPRHGDPVKKKQKIIKLTEHTRGVRLSLNPKLFGSISVFEGGPQKGLQAASGQQTQVREGDTKTWNPKLPSRP